MVSTKRTVRRLGICCAMIGLALGCDSSGDPPKDGGTEGLAVPRDVAPATDTRPLADLPLSGSDGREVQAIDLPTADVPITPADVPIPPVLDGAVAEVSVAAEAGLPQPYPDGGGLPCGNAGAACQTAADCCGLACVGGFCAGVVCSSDGTACTSNGQCCSSTCTNGTCAALNPLCKTAGNACTTGPECCSGVCNENRQCAQPGQVSYCTQLGDVCRADVECCTGVCNVAAGAAVGTCATITTACVVDGARCDNCGACCSHFCGPFGVGGPDICQPASGCRVEGDLCHRDSDCCGGDIASGMPGAGLVKCEPDPVYGGRIGKCSNPSAGNCPDGVTTCGNTCNPEGDVCHYTDTVVCEGATTSKRNNCCACVSGKECCKLDRTGIPRCNSLTACVPAGGSCAFSGDCCDNLPCVPDAVTGRLACGSQCVPLGGLCTTNADCCFGTLCQVKPGSLAGACITLTPPPGPDGGVPIVPDGSIPIEPDASVQGPDTAPPPVCSYFGQSCATSQLCCEGMTCVNTTTFADCIAADTDCVCFANE